MGRYAETRTILVPVDFSDSARPVLDYALEMARERGAAILLLHVVATPLVAPDGGGEPKGLAKECKDAEKELAALAAAAEPAKKVAIRAKVLVGSPSREIVREARDGKADLLVIGTHGRTGLRHVFLGSVAENVVRLAPCPVLTLRLKGFEIEKV